MIFHYIMKMDFALNKNGVIIIFVVMIFIKLQKCEGMLCRFQRK